MSTPIIRAAADGDISSIAKIEELCFSDPWTESAFKAFSQGEVFFAVIELAGEIVSYALTDMQAADFAELYNIATHPDFRKKGFSSMLMKAMKDEARKKGKEKILLEVREGNASAIALYEKFGFKVDGVRKNYYKNPNENGILMSLDLTKG